MRLSHKISGFLGVIGASPEVSIHGESEPCVAVKREKTIEILANWIEEAMALEEARRSALQEAVTICEEVEDKGQGDSSYESAAARCAMEIYMLERKMHADSP